MDKKLALPDFLKILTNNDIPVAKAMAVASKVFKVYNTPALLTQVDDPKLRELGIGDKDLRKLVLAAVRKHGYTRLSREVKSERECSALPISLASGSKPASAVQALITPKKKRKRGDDQFLPEAPLNEGSAYGNMDFGDVLDEEVLRMKSTVVNRAPLLTAWAMVVAERIGFEREEALSIGSAYTEMNAVAKGTSLGIIDQGRKKEMESSISDEQPYVDLMGRRPLFKTQLSKWRALISGSPALPGSAFSYISRAFRQTTPYVVGALRLLAESYPPQELNKIGFSLYADFRPAVDGWGKRGEVRCEHILSLKKKEGREMSETRALNRQHDRPEGSPWKKPRVLSLGEREAVPDEKSRLDEDQSGKLP